MSVIATSLQLTSTDEDDDDDGDDADGGDDGGDDQQKRSISTFNKTRTLIIPIKENGFTRTLVHGKFSAFILSKLAVMKVPLLKKELSTGARPIFFQRKSRRD